jgi:hypothetical protein
MVSRAQFCAKINRKMKKTLYFLAFVSVLIPGVLTAQPMPGAPAPVPTTRILAIGTLTSPLSPDEMKTLLPKEVKATVALYLDGKIDQWWVKQDGTGVVFLLDVTSAEDAGAMLEKLPMGVAKRMTFQLMPLGPLRPMRALLRD